MSVSNPWAYAAPTGFERVTAWGVARERRDQYDGRSMGRTYYSPHKQGRRKPMEHVIRDGKPYFRYKNKADEQAAGTGESLAHRLFKEAIASIASTRLSLGKHAEHRIKITHAEIEKEIVHAGGSYFADVYLQFESDDQLGLKWAGELYLEVHKAHLVPTDKIDEVRKLRVPMIEVTIPALFEYEHKDEHTTDTLEDQYRRKVKRVLEGENGFLAGKILSNPNSIEYLEAKLDEAQRARLVSEQRTAAAVAELADVRSKSDQFSQLLESSRATLASVRSDLTAAKDKADQNVTKVTELERKLVQEVSSKAQLRKKVFQLQLALCATGLIAILLFANWVSKAIGA